MSVDNYRVTLTWKLTYEGDPVVDNLNDVADIADEEGKKSPPSGIGDLKSEVQSQNNCHVDSKQAVHNHQRPLAKEKPRRMADAQKDRCS